MGKKIFSILETMMFNCLLDEDHLKDECMRIYIRKIADEEIL